MSKVMSATQARVHFGEVLRRVENNETITVERGGKPKAVILSIGEYQKLKSGGSSAPSWEEQLRRTQERFLREATNVEYDVEENIRQMREERSDQLFDDLR
jgi:prevent-host-death family protein